MGRDAEKLTARQQRFIEEYLIDLNATQAALRAGYSVRTANRQAAENMAKPVIKARIAEAMARRSRRTEIKQDAVLLEIARVAFADIRCLFDDKNRLKKINELGGEIAAAIASVKVATKSQTGGKVEYIHEIKLCSKVAALELGGKHLGLFEAHNRQKRPKVVVRDFTGDVIISEEQDE